MAGTEPMNVVVVVMDTARAGTVFTDDGIRFPTLSQLAAEGTCYTSAFADAPWTLPSHASLFTGTTPSKHGAHAGHKYLDSSLRTLPETLAEAGYITLGVTNNAWITDEFGFKRGFHEYHRAWQYWQSDIDVGPLAMGLENSTLDRMLVRRLLKGNPLMNIGNALYGKFLYRRTDSGAKRTNNIVRELLSTNSTPFFLFLNYLEPHLEYDPPDAVAGEYLDCSLQDAKAVPQDPWAYLCGATSLDETDFEILRQLYRAELAYLDSRIGELVAHLKQIGQWENTLLVVFGDHGENIGEHDLMDHQYSLHDTVVHVPLIIHGGPFSGGNSSDNLVQISDIFPTLIDVLDINDEETLRQFQGKSIAPRREESNREYVVSEYMAPQPSLETLEDRFGELPERVQGFDRQLRAIRTSENKLIRGSDGLRRLYDLDADPGEKTNIAAEKEDTVATLEALLDTWLESFDATLTNDSFSIGAGVRNRLIEMGYI